MGSEVWARVSPWLKASVALGAVSYILSRQPWPDLKSALTQLSPWALLGAAAVMLTGFCCGALRWRLVMIALGASAVPRLPTLLRMYLVGLFYNTYLPLAVSGDVIRGVSSRNAFGDDNASASMATVVVERMLGLAGVLTLTLVAIALQGARGPAHALALPAGVALPVVLTFALCLPLLRHAAPYVPAPLRLHVAKLPALQSYPAFAMAFVGSLGTQLLLVSAVHCVARSVHPSTHFTDTLFTAPLASAAGFLPLSVAGIGPRDVVLVALFELTGMPRPQGTATALAVLVVSLTVALVGGIIELGPNGSRRGTRTTPRSNA